MLGVSVAAGIARLQPVDGVGGHIQATTLVAVIKPTPARPHPHRIRRAAKPVGRLLERQPACPTPAAVALGEPPIELALDQLDNEWPERLEQRLADDELRPAGH